MKMRKLLPAVLLAVGALFLLSGCDAMLDAIFSTNQIKVQVSVYKGTNGAFFHDWVNGYPSSVTLTLTDVTGGGAQTTFVNSWDGIDGNYLYFDFLYPKLKEHTFALTAYYHSVFSNLDYGPMILFQLPDGSFTTSIGMPHSNSGDSTGHSISLYMYF